jgi:hypothetical protein
MNNRNVTEARKKFGLPDIQDLENQEAQPESEQIDTFGVLQRLGFFVFVIFGTALGVFISAFPSKLNWIFAALTAIYFFSGLILTFSSDQALDAPEKGLSIAMAAFPFSIVSAIVLFIVGSFTH